MRTATARADFIIIAECEACANMFYWKDEISHKTFSRLLGRIDDPIIALNQKIVKTDFSTKALRSCPKCGYIQSYMQPRWKKIYRLKWFWPVVLALSGLSLIFLVIYFPNEGTSKSRLIFGTIGGIMAL